MPRTFEYPRLRGLIYQKYGTQADLAKKIGKNPRWLNMRMTGQVQINKKDIDLLCQGLNIDPKDIAYYFANKEQVEKEDALHSEQ